MVFQPFTPSSKKEYMLQKIEEMSPTEFNEKFGEEEKEAVVLSWKQGIKETKELEGIFNTITTISFFALGIGLIMWTLIPNKSE